MKNSLKKFSCSRKTGINFVIPKFILLFSLIMMLGCRKEADLLFFNGRIYTVNENFRVADAMVIRDGTIVALGNAKSLKKKYRFSEEIDLHGKPVYPGLIDPHCHFYEYGLTLRQADLSGTTSLREIAAKLAAFAHPAPNAWIVGRGWDQNDWSDKKFPHKEWLDSIFPSNPVYLVRIDGHAAWVNSKALDLAGITAHTSITGGEILTDVHGPTGILIDNAITLVSKIIPPPTHDEKIQAIMMAQANCFSVGLTSVGDAGLDLENVLLIDSLQQAGLLRMHINAMLNPTSENREHFVRKGIYKTDLLTVRSVKLFADGALGSRGALLKKPYSDDSKNTGICLIKPDFLQEMMHECLQNGYQVNTHCIGDSAVSLMLHAYAGVLPEHNDLRWRIEHAQVVDKEDIDLFGKYGIIPSVQTTHATSDMYWAGERLGNRLVNAYAYKSLLAQNGWIPNGSDFPVESINPVYGFYAAFSRKDLKGFPAGGFQHEEALTREQAMRAMTIWAARAAFGENVRGSLEPGKRADFIITDQDLMTIDEEFVPSVKILEVYISGRKVLNGFNK